MKQYIDFKKVNCKDCYKCLRNCPVKSMRFINHQAEIIEDECILCGNCYINCPQKAKEIRYDINTVKALFKTSNNVYATVAPSFIANFDGKMSFRSLKNLLIKLGFKDAIETAEGAEIVTNEYEKIINDKKQDVVFSTCCPSINLLIRKYYPEAIKYMAKVVTPVIASSKLLKSRHKNCSVVFIGPCLAKKEEVDENLDSIDCAITFKELSEWIKTEGINIEDYLNQLEDDKKRYKNRLYPITNGIISTMQKNESFQYIAIDGIEKCKEAIEEVLNGNLHNCFIEMSSCIGSCIGGPGMTNQGKNIIASNINVINYTGDEYFKNDEKIINTKMNFSSLDVRKEKISDEVIKILLEKIGKTKPSDELNCGSCGYNTCKEKAYAMYYGKTEPSMCLPYLKNKAMSYMDDIVENTPNGIIVINDRCEIELINRSACNILKVISPSSVINQPIVRLLSPNNYIKVFNSKENIINDISYLSEYNKYIEQNIIYDHKFNVIMIIIRDITNEIIEKEKKEKISRETIEVTDKVIEKQMRAVQEIASLLGETTAETKIALEKLKESLDDK